ncbi:phage tail assembly protein [Lysobacter sp. K5869]|uniref:phage tail assembly protein n=1 Tax=Lysobacter sp. K5869 TaxID=2820808 RepID=UPI001C0601E1|nr:phage tail assembly protein [Lysobacter sp. K5869]QWP76076.1 phage tail assembly protein [Lysobacter sp. K5869]
MSKSSPAAVAAASAAAAHATAVGSAVITLEQPLKRGDSEITAVTVRRPASGELRGLSMLDLMRMEVDAVHKVLPRVTLPTLTAFDVAQLDPADTAQFAMAIADFFLTRAQRAGSLTA